MSDSIRLIDPRKLHRNPENPRLIFRADELETLRESIAEQGILVPLTVYRDGRDFFVLDGERRWRCALKLGLERIPAIVQPTPGRLQNLMMMFAIHNARKDWDPLPTALKLEALEKEFKRINGHIPTEAELAGLASLTRGEVRRLKKLLSLPSVYRKELLAELEKPRHMQRITVDQVIEATKGVEALTKRGLVHERDEESLRRAVVDKFKSGVIANTVAPRKLARLARAFERGEVSRANARRVVRKLQNSDTYSIDDAFSQSVEQVDFEHGIENLITRLIAQMEIHEKRGYETTGKLDRLVELLIAKLKSFQS